MQVVEEQKESKEEDYLTKVYMNTLIYTRKKNYEKKHYG